MSNIIRLNVTWSLYVILWHAGSQGGHSRVEATVKRLFTLFYWKHMRSKVKQFIQRCDVCQKVMSDLVAYPGLLWHLPIPYVVWSQISIGFIDGLPKSNRYEVSWWWLTGSVSMGIFFLLNTLILLNQWLWCSLILLLNCTACTAYFMPFLVKGCCFLVFFLARTIHNTRGTT